MSWLTAVVTELRHEREKQDLKQEILNLKALVMQRMLRQETARNLNLTTRNLLAIELSKLLQLNYTTYSYK